MTVAAFAIPAGSVLGHLRPILAGVGVVVLAMRPLLGFGFLAVALWLFKPILTGLARAAVMLVRPRRPMAWRSERRNTEGVVALNRMARELDTLQPSLAAELRLLAARG